MNTMRSSGGGSGQKLAIVLPSFLAVFLLLPAPSQAQDWTSGADPYTNEEHNSALPVVEAFLEAFNSHNPKAMFYLVTRDFQRFGVDDDGEVDLEIQGPEQLYAEMTTYFAEHPGVRTTISDVIDGPVYVTFRQTVSNSASTTTVFEVQDYRVRRIWTFESAPSL